MDGKEYPYFVECGCCGHYHRQGYQGDCRNDDERFNSEEVAAVLETEHGSGRWYDHVLEPGER